MAEVNPDAAVTIVPADTYPDAFTALERLIVDGTSIRAAVAFVTDAGVSALREILDQRTGVTLEVVARAADATTPSALETLWRDVGADVSVVIGKDASAFHPKLWLIESNGRLTVLSGSGNLTSSGLRGNDEQFELYSVPASGPEAVAQTDRFDRLVSSALPLETVHGGTTWGEWLLLIRRTHSHHSAIKRLGQALANRDPKPNRAADEEGLLDDLDDLYHRTMAAKLPKENGEAYRPGRFRQQIARARKNEADPVGIVRGICRRRSPGFDVILESGRRDLTVEAIVLDTTKPYHDLFSEQTRSLCIERMRAFDAQ